MYRAERGQLLPRWGGGSAVSPRWSQSHFHGWVGVRQKGRGETEEEERGPHRVCVAGPAFVTYPLISLQAAVHWE